jgi:hypothetical protein
MIWWTSVTGAVPWLQHVSVRRMLVATAVSALALLPRCGGGGPGAPSIARISPYLGPANGGITVTIDGNNFQSNGATVNWVHFGNNSATNISVQNNNQMTVTIPNGPWNSTVSVQVNTNGGTSNSDNFYYYGGPTVTGVSPSSGPYTGGTRVTVNGTNFYNVSGVYFGKNRGSSVSVTSSTQLQVTSPRGSIGQVNVTVATSSLGGSPLNSSDIFTYVGPPAVTALSPSSGPISGNTWVTVSGSNLLEATGVSFGGIPAISYRVVSNTEISALSPPHVPGPVDVTVTNAYGTSATSTSDKFTYVLQSVSVVSPNAGPLQNGPAVTITGSGFSSATVTAVDFGSTPARSYSVPSPTMIIAYPPNVNTPEVVSVTVTITVSGQKFTSNGVPYTFAGTPAITSMSAYAGSPGSTIKVSGSGFSYGSATVTAVDFCDGPGNCTPAAAGSYKVLSPTLLDVTVPRLPAGTYALTVTTVGGTTTANS